MGLPDRSWAKRLLDHTSRGLLALHVLLGLYYASYSLLLLFLLNLACAVRTTTSSGGLKIALKGLHT